MTKLETSLKDPTFMKWSRSGPQLVIGTVKGNVLIYNKQSRKKVRGPTAHTIHPARVFASARRCRPCRPCDVARVTAAPARRPAPAATSRQIEPGRDAAGDGCGADRPVATARGCGRGAKATRTERQRRA